MGFFAIFQGFYRLLPSLRLAFGHEYTIDLHPVFLPASCCLDRRLPGYTPPAAKRTRPQGLAPVYPGTQSRARLGRSPKPPNARAAQPKSRDPERTLDPPCVRTVQDLPSVRYSTQQGSKEGDGL